MSVPDFATMTTEQFEAWQQQPRKCSRCPAELTNGDFKITTCRGKRVLRTWCPKCLADYYFSRNPKRRGANGRAYVTVADRRKKAKLALVYSVAICYGKFEVRRTEGEEPYTVVSTHDTEQEAERAVKERQQEQKKVLK